MSNGVVPLDGNTLQLLHQKHPASKNTGDEVLLSGEKAMCTSSDK